MKIADFIAQLGGILAEHGNLDVWVAIDAEGNGIKPLDGAWADAVNEDESDFLELNPETLNAVVVWPV